MPKAEIDACPEVGWIRDFADPQTILYVPFYGPAITPTNNSNWGQVNDPTINAAMAKATLVVGASARAAAWAKVDDMLVDQAVAVPWIFDKQPNIESGQRSRNQRPLEHRVVGLHLHVAAESVSFGFTDAGHPGAPFAAPRETGRVRSMTGYIVRRLLWGCCCSCWSCW